MIIDLPGSEALPILPDPVVRVVEEVNRRIAGMPDLPAMMDFPFEAMKPHLPCDRLALALILEDGRRAICRQVRADYGNLRIVPGYMEDLGDGSLKKLVKRGTARIINDLSRYLDEHPGSESIRLAVEEGIRSSLTGPLVVEGRRVGLVFWNSRHVSAFTRAHLALHRAVTDRIAQAVEKAWIIEQLEAARRSYGEMLAFVSHELKSPVAGMVMEAKLLRGGYAGPVGEEVRERLERMVGRGEYLLDLIHDYLDLSLVESGGLEFRPEAVTDFCGEIIEPALENQKIALERNDNAVIRDYPSRPVAADVDRRLIGIVLPNLLSNAIKYGIAGGHVRVRLTAGPEELRLTVRNDGPGFRPEERNRLFRKFSRLDFPGGKDRVKGTGVGQPGASSVCMAEGCWQFPSRGNGRNSVSACPAG